VNSTSLVENFENVAIYNTLRTKLTCPRCGAVGEFEINMYFGNRQMFELRVGDRYPWVARKQPQNGGRPDGGNTAGEGYSQCTQCHKDSFWRVMVREDVIVNIEPDNEKPGYIQS
jgi:hypothetical protein